MQIEVLIALLLFGSASFALLEQQGALHQHLLQTRECARQTTLKRNQNECIIARSFFLRSKGMISSAK
ncbi:MAG: hypothetical protein H2069_03935 [Legionella sp.]|nr:hypothetical protein [Legionella sp.]